MNYSYRSVKDIFDKYKIINVPYYQRDYVWGSKNDGRNLYKFIDDIFTEYDQAPEKDYFIGTLAFCSDKVNDVIDGQQRITSLVLILTILSRKCSEEIEEKNHKILFPKGNDEFVINEENYLTEEIKKNLGLPNKYNSQGYSVNLSKTVERIESQIKNSWGGHTKLWYDSLYKYILNKVKFISLEYTNIAESLKYFLNINSLSIQLTQSDIFYSILSQSIRISHSTSDIFHIKNKIQNLANEFKGLSKIAENKNGKYIAYDQNCEKGVDNIIYIFLNAYYQNDKRIDSLNDAGIGKWMSFNKNSVFNDPIEAQKFVNKFTNYINDLNFICGEFCNFNGNIKDKTSSLYMSWILLDYEKYFDLLKVLIELFRTRHNYIDNCENLYVKGSYRLDINKLNEISKRLVLTLLKNYICDRNKRLDGFVSNISLDDKNIYKRTINDIVGDITIDDIFNLTYKDNNAVSNLNINDKSRIIKVLLAFQEAFLNWTANKSKLFNNYLKDILLTNIFSIEHLYSVKEFKDEERLKNWQKKGKFLTEPEFDNERFSFNNLSLLDMRNNSLAGDDEIKEKLSIYKTASRVCESENEYLIMSFVQDSPFYKNADIKKLGLPERTIENIDQNTWESSKNNRKFNEDITKLFIDYVSKM